MARTPKPWAATVLAAALMLVTGGALAGMEQEEMRFAAPSANLEMGLVAPPGAPGLPDEMLLPLPDNVVRDSTSVTVTLTPWLKEREDREQRRYEALFEGIYALRCLEPEKDQQQGAQAQNQEEQEPEPVKVSVFFPYPANADTIPDATVTVDGKEPDDAKFSQRGVGFVVELKPGQKREIKVSYRAFGTEDFRYALEDGNRIRHLDFTLVTTDASRRPVVPLAASLRPSEPLTLEGGGYSAKWVYDNLLTGRDIMIEMPMSVVRSDLSDRSRDLVPVAAAVAVLFALVLLFAGRAAGKPVGAGEIVLVVLAIAVFYPMLVFLSRHFSVSIAFAGAFIVTGVLVMSALRREHGMGFALRTGGFAMVAVLGLLSLAAIAGEGAGTLVTLSAVLLVAFAIRVAPALRPETPAPPPPPPAAARDAVTERGEETWGEDDAEEGAETPEQRSSAELPTAAVEAEPAPPERFCAYCGCAVEPDFEYCPRCGKGQELTVCCAACGFEVCRECGPAYRFCPNCGSPVTVAGRAPDQAAEQS